MNKFRKHISAAIATITGAITLDSYRRLLENDKVIQKATDLLEETVRRSCDLADKLDQVFSTSQKNKTEVESKLNHLKANLDNIADNSVKLSNATPKNSETNVLSQDLTESVNKTNGILDEIIRLISDTPTSGTASGSNTGNNLNFSIDFFSQYTQFLSTLTTTQVGAVAYIIISLTIIFLLINILLAHYGDKIIYYFKLEVKYPKLSKFIMLRKIFNNFYIVTYSLTSIFLLLYVLYINVLILSSV
jgi:Tfp pilus assembly major pilin PilA